MRYYRAVPSFFPAVTLEQVKANSRIDYNEEDSLINGFIAAAQERAEQETGLVFGEGEWVIETDPCGDIQIPVWPVSSVLSVMDGDQEFTDYEILRSNRSVRLRSGSWPGSVVIRVTAGMPAPETVRAAIMLMASYWISQRETASADTMTEVPYGASVLLALNRRVFV